MVALFGLSALACAGPKSGDYTFEADGSPSGDCNEDLAHTEDFEAEIEIDGDELSFESEDLAADDADCELDGEAFSCLLQEEVSESEGTALTITWVLDGEWVTNEEIAATFAFEIACSGPDCPQYEEMGFTCSIEQDFVGTLDD
jgi:hypothetical protein